MKIKLHAKLTIYFLIALAVSGIFSKSFFLSSAILFIVFHLIIYFFVTRPLSRFSLWVSNVLKGQKQEFRPIIFSRDEIGELGELLRGLVERGEKNYDSRLAQALKLDAVLLGMAEGVIVTGKDSQILLMNPAAQKMFFIDYDPVGKKIFEVIFNSAVTQSVDKVLYKKERQVACEVIFKAGEKVLHLTVSVLARGESIDGAVLVFHDISELKRLEEARKEFVANVSHELRTPAASIQGYAEALLDGALEDKAHARDFTRTIYDDAQRMNKLISGLLDLARLDAGKAKLSIKAIDLGAVISKAVNILDKAIKDSGLKIVLKIAPDLPKVQADEEALTRVILNLLENAIKYSHKSGQIFITAQASGQFVQVDIADNGIGIPPEDLSRIFERFYRVDKSRSKESGGTGLGLSIVKHLVTAQGGKVSVTSTFGKGSTFSFTLLFA